MNIEYKLIIAFCADTLSSTYYCSVYRIKYNVYSEYKSIIE